MTLKQILKSLYPYQKIRVTQFGGCYDTGIKYADDKSFKEIKYCRVARIYTLSDSVLGIEVIMKND